MKEAVDKFIYNMRGIQALDYGDFMRLANHYLIELQTEIAANKNTEVDKLLSDMKLQLQYYPNWNVPLTRDFILHEAQLLIEAIEPLALIENKNYTLSETIHFLQNHGYTEDFNLENACREFDEDPSQFVIEETFRFDNQSDPDDQCVLFAVHNKNRNIKGILLNSFGLYHDTATSKLANKLQTDYHDAYHDTSHDTSLK